MKFSKITVLSIASVSIVSATYAIVSATAPTPLQKAEQMFAETSNSLLLSEKHEAASYEALQRANEAHEAAKKAVENARKINNNYRCAIANLKMAQGEEIKYEETKNICELGK